MIIQIAVNYASLKLTTRNTITLWHSKYIGYSPDYTLPFLGSNTKTALLWNIAQMFVLFPTIQKRLPQNFTVRGNR